MTLLIQAKPRTDPAQLMFAAPIKGPVMAGAGDRGHRDP
jgi:hypothetical protein